jgi:hypothetical protein
MVLTAETHIDVQFVGGVVEYIVPVALGQVLAPLVDHLGWERGR